MINVTFNEAGFCLDTTNPEGLNLMITGTMEEAKQLINNRHDQIKDIEAIQGSFMLIESAYDIDGKEVESFRKCVKFRENVFVYLVEDDFEEFIKKLQHGVAKFAG